MTTLEVIDLSRVLGFQWVILVTLDAMNVALAAQEHPLLGSRLEIRCEDCTKH